MKKKISKLKRLEEAHHVALVKMVNQFYPILTSKAPRFAASLKRVSTTGINLGAEMVRGSLATAHAQKQVGG